MTASLTASGRTADALAAWEEMVRQVAWSDPGGINDAACHDLANLGAKLTAAGKVADPEPVLAPGLADRRAKLAADPAATEVRIDLRRGYRALGLIFEKMGRFQAAEEAFAKVIDFAPAPPDGADTRVKTERHLVFGALIGRAVCLDALGRDGDAEAAWEALYKFNQSTAALGRPCAIQALARNGQPDRAIRLAEKVFPAEGNVGLLRYNAGCMYSLRPRGRTRYRSARRH